MLAIAMDRFSDIIIYVFISYLWSTYHVPNVLQMLWLWISQPLLRSENMLASMCVSPTELTFCLKPPKLSEAEHLFNLATSNPYYVLF